MKRTLLVSIYILVLAVLLIIFFSFYFATVFDAYERGYGGVHRTIELIGFPIILLTACVHCLYALWNSGPTKHSWLLLLKYTLGYIAIVLLSLLIFILT